MEVGISNYTICSNDCTRADFYILLAPYHPITLATRTASSQLIIGDKVGITGGTICAVMDLKKHLSEVGDASQFEFQFVYGAASTS